MIIKGLLTETEDRLTETEDRLIGTEDLLTGTGDPQIETEGLLMDTGDLQKGNPQTGVGDPLMATEDLQVEGPQTGVGGLLMTTEGPQKEGKIRHITLQAPGLILIENAAIRMKTESVLLTDQLRTDEALHPTGADDHRTFLLIEGLLRLDETSRQVLIEKSKVVQILRLKERKMKQGEINLSK